MEDELQQSIKWQEKELKKRRMLLNISKTKAMVTKKRRQKDKHKNKWKINTASQKFYTFGSYNSKQRKYGTRNN